MSEEVDPDPQLRLAPILIDALLRDFQGLQDSEISEESDDDMGMRSPIYHELIGVACLTPQNN